MNIRKYGFYRFATVSPKLKIADTEYNSDIICSVLENNQQSDILVFPELSLTSYSCQDLFFQKNLIDNVFIALEKICKFSEKTKSTLIIGAPLISENRLFNTAIVISSGKILGAVPKTYLANKNEYYENRWFASEFDRSSDTINILNQKIPFGADLIFENSNDKNFRFGIEICEDLWAIKSPNIDLALSNCIAIFNLSASNEYLGKSEIREDYIKVLSQKLNLAYIYANAGIYESTTDTVFSGTSYIYENGKLLKKSNSFSFENEICIADIDTEILRSERLKNSSFSNTRSSENFRIISINLAEKEFEDFKRPISIVPFIPKENDKYKVYSEISQIQVVALCRRLLHISCKNVIIGISGGIDSTLALLVVFKAFKKLNYDLKGIFAVTMPGFGTTNRTKNNAIELAKKLDITLLEIPIENSVKLHFKEINHNENIHNTVYENAQARRRTHILMDLANKYNGIVLGTGDLSESALGWCTFSGDHISMYGINSGIPKTLIRNSIKWYAEEFFDSEISNILLDICDTPISPELLPPDKNDKILQETEQNLGPYLLNDFILYYFIRYNFSPNKIKFLADIAFKNMFDTNIINNTIKQFFKRFFQNQFKRNAIPDGPKICEISLSPRSDWKMPSDAEFNLWIEK